MILRVSAIFPQSQLTVSRIIKAEQPATTTESFLLGALDDGGEYVICTDPEMASASEDEVAYVTAFPNLATQGSLVCATVALNHLTINHTTGQGKLQGFSLLVARVLELDYPKDHTNITQEQKCRKDTLTG